MNDKFIKLTINNYQQLQEHINRIDPNYYLSALNLCLWENYGLELFYLAEDDAIYVYIKILNGKYSINGFDIKKFYILRPIIKKNVVSYHYLIKAVDNIKEYLKNLDSLCFDRLYKNDLRYLKKYDLVSVSDSSYVYLTEKLKKFPGKKMQKKRNLYNFYLNNYSSQTKFVFYDKSYNNQILEYVKKHIIDSHGSLREYEYNYISDLLNSSDNNLSGLLMFYQDKLVGVTVGYSRNNIYEIFLEKADKSLKGSYQFLLSNNLEQNNINLKYVDRQDSERQEGLEQSKKSYKPYYIYNTYLIKVNFYETK